MNNRELIAELSKKTSVSQKNVGSLLQAYIEVVGESLVKERQTAFLSAGYFETYKKDGHEAINVVPAKTSVTFKSSSTLKKHLKTLAL
ncbi:MAG: HU family DNA-binding protein [Prevotellaceae bacterium]|jgi:nucleoid DNA-binding protein|nr:HU family DNA-binding protein [Prevotellaceae bacterium]